MTALAADPWALEFDHQRLHELPQRGAYLERFFDVAAVRQCVPLRVRVDSDWIQRLYQSRDVLRAFGALIGRINRQLVDPARDGDPAMGSCRWTPPSVEASLSRHWGDAVIGALREDTRPDWRDPVVLVPRARLEAWHQANAMSSDKCELVHPHGENDVARVLAAVEDLDQHPYFVPDLDPWAGERSRSGFPLPQPRCVAGLPMAEWSDALQAVNRWNQAGEYAFHPPPRWNPATIGKSRWRNGPFRRGTKGEHNGPVDRWRRVWRADRNEGHWDVQCAKQECSGYVRVCPAGSLLSGGNPCAHFSPWTAR